MINKHQAMLQQGPSIKALFLQRILWKMYSNYPDDVWEPGGKAYNDAYALLEFFNGKFGAQAYAMDACFPEDLRVLEHNQKYHPCEEFQESELFARYKKQLMKAFMMGDSDD